MGISHIGIPVSDSDRSWAFYTRALEPLGIGVSLIIGPGDTESGGTAIGFGTPEVGGAVAICTRGVGGAVAICAHAPAPPARPPFGAAPNADPPPVESRS